MNPANRIIDVSELKPGDLLLCVLSGATAEQVEKVTGSKYTHAGICYNSKEVVHMTIRGIRKHSVSQLLNSSQHIAVLRNPYIWNRRRLQLFQQFMDDALANRLHYDMEAADTFEIRKGEHQIEVHAKLYKHFENGLQPEDHHKLRYICSDLVVATFIEIGFIDPSAAILYKGDTYSAGDLGRDPTFGFFVGYLKPQHTEEIPDDDEFTNNVTLGELCISGEDMVNNPPQTDQKLDNGEIQRLFKTSGFQETLEDLKDYCSTLNRLVPMPEQWNKLYGMLNNTRQKSSGGWEPPLPLILAAWDNSSPTEKRNRFEEHIRWADAQGQLGEIGAYLRSLPEEQWFHLDEI